MHQGTPNETNSAVVCLATSQDLGDSAVEYDEDEDYNDIQQSENEWGGNTTSRKRFTDSRNAFVLEVTTVLCPLFPLYFVSSYLSSVDDPGSCYTS